MKPMISIIVPVFNAEANLFRCLKSLQEQTYSNLEFLLIDDGSQDKSAAICKAFSNGDDRFKYYYQSNAGVSAARNLGLDMAVGEFIGFCDSDDWTEPDMYEFLLMLAENHHADIAISAFYVDTLTGQDENCGTDEQIVFGARDAIAEMHMGRRFAGHLMNKLFKKSVIGSLRLDSDVSMMEDMLFVWRAFHNSTKIVFQHRKEYHYVLHNSSSSHCYSEKFWSVQKAGNRMLSLMKQYYPENIVLAQKTIIYGNIILARRTSEAKKNESEELQQYSFDD